MAAIGAACGYAVAQGDPKVGTTVNDPIGPVPDPARVGMTLPKDIKCTGTEGVQPMCIAVWRPGQARPLYREVHLVAGPFLQAALSQQ